MGFTLSTIDQSDPNFKDIYTFHGKSAYQAAVENGYVGTEDEWILSLRELRFGTKNEFTDTDPQLMYVDLDTNHIYRYDETLQEFIAIGGTLKLGETEDTAYYGDKGKEAYEHAIGGVTTHPFLPLAGGTMTGSIVTQTLLPSEEGTYDIGSSSLPYKRVYSGEYRLYESEYGTANATIKTNTVGTTETIGSGLLTIGNSIASGNNGNAIGQLIIYGQNSGYSLIMSSNNTTANHNIYIPARSGILALLTDTVAAADKLSTARTIELTSGATGSTTFDGSANIAIEVTSLDPSKVAQTSEYNLVTTAQIESWTAKPTTEEVASYISDLVGSSPETLDTLAEIATALGEDPNFATTMTTELGKKLNLAGGTMTGGLVTQTLLPGDTALYDLGSDTYRYNDIHGTTIYEGGTALSDKYLSLSGGTMTGNLYCKNIIPTSDTYNLGSTAVPFYTTYSTVMSCGYYLPYDGIYYNGIELSMEEGLPYIQIGNPSQLLRGTLIIVGESSGYTRIRTLNNSTSYNDVYLPATAGTLALLTDTVAAADKLSTARTIALTGSVTGSGTFDGSGNLSITTTTNHTHTYLPLTGGTLTGALTCNTSLTVKTTLAVTGNATFGGNITATGTITGSKVYNPVWADYAEFFLKEDPDEVFMPGDIISWNKNGVTKSRSICDEMVVGIYSDNFGHIVGGDEGKTIEENMEKYVPVGLVGRLDVNVTGKVKRGNLIVSSDIPGIGIAVERGSEFAMQGSIIGKAIADKESTELGKVQVVIMLS